MNPSAVPRNMRRWFRVVALCTLAATWPGPPAHADEYDALNLVFSDSYTHDANVFRAPDASGPQADRINVFSAGLKINKPYAQ